MVCWVFFFAFNQHVLPMFINRNCSVCIGFRCKWRCYHCTIWFWRESEKCPWVRGLRFFCYLTCLKQTGWQISNGSSPAGLQLATISHDIGMLLELRKYKILTLETFHGIHCCDQNEILNQLKWEGVLVSLRIECHFRSGSSVSPLKYFSALLHNFPSFHTTSGITWLLWGLFCQRADMEYTPVFYLQVLFGKSSAVKKFLRMKT